MPKHITELAILAWLIAVVCATIWIDQHNAKGCTELVAVKEIISVDYYGITIVDLSGNELVIDQRILKKGDMVCKHD